tara:strand:+ start:1268 stop:1651 length:384 start_codon:yes stop_codon:yes gene_type:complete
MMPPGDGSDWELTNDNNNVMMESLVDDKTFLFFKQTYDNKILIRIDPKFDINMIEYPNTFSIKENKGRIKIYETSISNDIEISNFLSFMFFNSDTLTKSEMILFFQEINLPIDDRINQIYNQVNKID